jgi:hypothetical protein
MFKSKYSVSLLNVNWEPINIKLKLSIIPRIDEFIYLDNQYYQVLNIVHQLNKNQEIFIVIDKAFQPKK